MKSMIELIRDLRIDHDLSQADVAEILGTSQQHYSKYETGTIDLPLRHFTVLLDYYRVSADYLLGRNTSRKECSMDEKSMQLTKDYTGARFLQELSTLDKSSQKAMVEFLEFQKYRQEQNKKQEK